MVTYKLVAELEIQHQPAGMGLPDDEYEVSYPKVEIEYRYTPGRPAFTPRGEYGPIDPPDPAEVDLVGAKLIDGDGLLPTTTQVQDWAQDFLDSDSGFNEAVANAEEWSREMRHGER